MKDRHFILLTHILGADPRNKKSDWGYRNYFADTPNSLDQSSFEEMIDLGLVVKGTVDENYVHYHATKKGARVLGFKDYQLRNTNFMG